MASSFDQRDCSGVGAGASGLLDPRVASVVEIDDTDVALVFYREDQILADGVGVHDAVLGVELRRLELTAVGLLQLGECGAGPNSSGGLVAPVPRCYDRTATFP